MADSSTDERIEDLVADGSEQAFIRLVERVQGRESAQADVDVEAWRTARADRNAGPALAALLESSRAREIDAYALEAPPPGDFRSRGGAVARRLTSIFSPYP